MKNLLILLALTWNFPLFSQNEHKPPESGKENIIKVNLGSLLVKNIALQYERSVGAHTTLALGIRFQPYGDVPFQSWLKDQVDEPDIQVGLMQVGNFAITPEFRYYFKESLKGLYLAPYLRYANFKVEAPVTYTGTGTPRTAFFNGNINSFSGGLLFGSQFRLSKCLTLDWWILGAHWGGSSGQLDFVSSLSPSEQEDLRQSLDDVDIPFFDIEHEIDANGGRIRSQGAWAGFRGFAINLGWRF